MHRLENLVSFVHRESSRNSIDEKFACRDAPSSRNDRMRANSEVRATMILDRIDAEITTVVAFGNINLIYALVKSGVRLERAWVICKASKYRNCYRKQLYGRCALYGSEGREYCGELFRRQSSSISYGLNLIARRGELPQYIFFALALERMLATRVWRFTIGILAIPIIIINSDFGDRIADFVIANLRFATFPDEHIHSDEIDSRVWNPHP